MKTRALLLFAVTILMLGCWVAVTLLWGVVGPVDLAVITIIGCLFISPLVLAFKRPNAIVWICAGLIILATWFVPASTLVKRFPVQNSDPFSTPLAFTLLVTISLALIVVALLLNSGLILYKTRQEADTNSNIEDNEDSKPQRRHNGRSAAATLGLSVLLLAGALYKFTWFMIWDNTYDGLGYLWLLIPILVVFSTTIMLIIALPEKMKMVAFTYLLLIPVMIAITASAQHVDFHQLTEERAAQVNQAIEYYSKKEGRYPENLRALTPRYLLSIPGPVIIYGQEWCYDSGEDYYRIGYIDREHWSAPHLIGQIYQSRGEVPDLYGICEYEAAALQRRHPDFPYEYWVEGEK